MFPDYKQCSLSFIIFILVISLPVNAQVVQEFAPELTEHGHPNFQGYWTNPFQTPLERPLALGDQRVYSKSEVEDLREFAIALDKKRRSPLDPQRPAPKIGGEINNQADGNFEIMPIELAQISGKLLV